VIRVVLELLRHEAVEAEAERNISRCLSSMKHCFLHGSAAYCHTVRQAYSSYYRKCSSPSRFVPSFPSFGKTNDSYLYRNSHRITECFGLGGTFRGHPAQPPAVSRDIFNWVRLLRAPSNLAWNVSRDGASTTSLGNLGQCLTTLTAKKFFLISGLNLPSFSLKPLLLVLPFSGLYN